MNDALWNDEPANFYTFETKKQYICEALTGQEKVLINKESKQGLDFHSEESKPCLGLGSRLAKREKFVYSGSLIMNSLTLMKRVSLPLGARRAAFKWEIHFLYSKDKGGSVCPLAPAPCQVTLTQCNQCTIWDVLGCLPWAPHCQQKKWKHLLLSLAPTMELLWNWWWCICEVFYMCGSPTMYNLKKPKGECGIFTGTVMIKK